jgi:hypothetical protein
MTQAIVFVSTCPSCRREQPQDAFSVADLLRLLNGGYPIEAYCVPCDEFWPIGLKERVELGEAVTAACEGTYLRDAVAPRTAERSERDIRLGLSARGG